MTHVSRRSFLKRISVLTATAGVAACSPWVIPGTALGLEGSVPPSERITMGLIGCGNHGIGWNLQMMALNPMQQVIALCDVDKNYLEAARQSAISLFSQRYGTPYKMCDTYTDFRDLVNRKDIDAVCIATPDHWHVLLAVFAMKAGKDVICEKPTLTIEEGRILSDTQKKTNRVFQTASENRSIDSFQYMVNTVRNGHIGELRNIKVLFPPGNTSARAPGILSDEPNARVAGEVPPELDYETWLGPAPVVPYIPARVHYNWRWNFAYSGGVLTDWGSHLINIAQWANNTDDTGPVEVQGTGVFPDFNDVWNTPADFRINYRYQNGVKMEVWTEVPGVKFEGTKGWIMMRGWRQELRASDDKLLNLTFEGEQNLGRPESTVKAAAPVGGEHIDFALSVKSRKPCYYTAECGHRNHTIAHIGNISMLLGGAKLQWNPDTEEFVGEHADEANKHFCYTRPQRDPWTFAKVDSWINLG
ncbi:MAG: Gfo/Idh/MocA family oxidoreductase [Planctomycetaceae bacterium]|nr:Gfo/Idh/MocA family oxidoreductase [Planctomycetaceae bacterium]